MNDEIFDEIGCEDYYDGSEDGGSFDMSDDADALASAGHGMDEDYAPDQFLDSEMEDRLSGGGDWCE